MRLARIAPCLLWPVLCLSAPTARSAPEAAPYVDPTLGEVVARCGPGAGKKPVSAPTAERVQEVWVFKQWHLAPQVDTRDLARARALPQAANQASIYRQLDAWIRAKSLTTVLAEGCAGELTRKSDLRFNGWGIDELAKASADPGYAADVVTHVPLKLEAKHGKALRTACADDLALMKENAMALSDARGIVGFMSRIEQHRNDPARVKTYLEGVTRLYHLPAGSSPDAALARLGMELRNAIGRARAAIDRRNEIAVDAALADPASRVALVFGGLHAEGIQALLEKKGVRCAIVEPVGYPSGASGNNEAALLARLEDLVRPASHPSSRASPVTVPSAVGK